MWPTKSGTPLYQHGAEKAQALPGQSKWGYKSKERLVVVGAVPAHQAARKTLAEEAIRHWPELRSHSLRKALFGGKKFAKIADEIGLIRERYELIGFAGSTPAPWVTHKICG